MPQQLPRRDLDVIGRALHGDDGDVGDDRAELFDRDAAGASHGRRGHSAVDDRRLDTDVGGPAVDHQVDRAVEIGEHMGGGGRAGAREPIGARCRHRHADRHQQCHGHRMRRHPHGDRRQPCGHDAGHLGRFEDDERERARPERPRQGLGHRRHLGRDPRQVADRRQMDDHRVGGRATLGREDRGDRRRVERRCPEAVDGLGRERDQTAGAQPRRRRADGGGIGVPRIDGDHRRAARRHRPIVALRSAAPRRRRPARRRNP